MTEPKQPRVIKANYLLQAKVGAGPLDAKKVEECQRIMDQNDEDFAPLAQLYLDRLKQAILDAKSGRLDLAQAVNEMTGPVMQLKANAAMFRYDLIGNLANVMLSFLEAIKTIDNVVIEIVDAHHKTLSAIVMKKMSGDGGKAGKQLEQELKDACMRYFQKKKARIEAQTTTKS